MRLDFTLTPADLHEATTVLKPNGKPTRPMLVGLVWAYIVLVPWLLVLVGPSTDPARTANLWALVAPGTAAVTLLLILTTIGSRARNRPARAAPAAGGTTTPGVARLLGLVVFLPAALLVVAMAPALAVAWHPSDPMAMLVTLAPCQAAVLGVIPVYVVRQHRRGRRAWATSPWQHRPKVVDVTDDGLRVADAEVEVLYRWPSLHRFLERPTLFLLYTAQKHAVIVPRRAFPSPQAEQAFRGLLQTHVGHGRFLSRDVAFPVVPMS